MKTGVGRLEVGGAEEGLGYAVMVAAGGVVGLNMLLDVDVD